MSATFKKSGSTTATLKSRKLTREHDYRCTEVQVYEGSIDDLKALGKSVGDAFVTVDGGNTVYTRTLEYETHANGPVSRLVVTATNWTSGGGSTTDTDYELEWMRVDKDIRSHPKFLSGGANALTSSDWSKVVEWEAETNADKKLALYNALGVNPGMLAYRLRQGETSYPVWIPVARKSYNTIIRPTTSAVGKIDTPPSQCNAPAATATGQAYTYILMADRATRQRGVWRRQQEWVGFDEVDSFIYS